MRLFHSRLWSDSVKLLALPALAFTEDGNPELTPAEFSVLTVGAADAQTSRSNCKFTMSVAEFMKRTGYKKKAVVIEALKGLERKGFIRQCGEQKPRTFELCNPRNGEGLSSAQENKRRWKSFCGALQARHLPYFWFPVTMVTNLPQLSAAA